MIRKAPGFVKIGAGKGAVVRPRETGAAMGCLAVGLVAALAAAGGWPGGSAAPAGGFAWRLPPGFPPPRVPPDNPMTPVKVELGRRLFHDARLSGNHTQACSSCHRQRLAFTDGRARAVGSTGAVHPRGSPSLANVAYAPALTWADPDLRRLEDQALVPLFGERPVEMGLAGREAELAARLAAEPLYARMFREAFPDDPEPIGTRNAARALAAFERTLISGGSPYDRLVYEGRDDDLTEHARRGMRLFFSDALACARCHGGFNFSGPVTFDGAAGPVEPEFHDTGLHAYAGRPPFGGLDTGLNARTGRRRDIGRFRAPTLRNVALTAPYMHDGSLATLGEVIDHYAAGGRAAAARGSRRGDLRPFAIDAQGRRELIAFLESLTDVGFVTDPCFADPRETGDEACP